MNYNDEVEMEEVSAKKAEAAKVAAPRASLDVLDGFEAAKNIEITLKGMNYKFVPPKGERPARFSFWKNGTAVIMGKTVPAAVNVREVLLEPGFVVDESGSSAEPGDLVVTVAEQITGGYFRYFRRIVDGKKVTYKEVASTEELKSLVEGQQFLRLELVSSPRFVSYRGKPAVRVAKEGATVREDARRVMAKYFAARDAKFGGHAEPAKSAKDNESTESDKDTGSPLEYEEEIEEEESLLESEE